MYAIGKCGKHRRKKGLLFSMKETLLTKQGLEAFQKELEYLKTEKRNEIAEKIKVARSFGDLSENSEYDEAKNEQAKMENRIAELEEMLKNVKIIDEGKKSSKEVNTGTKVRILDVEMDEELEYQVVGSSEADPMNGKISDESPVGSALIGHKVGETVVASTPSGELQFKILKILK